jgi:sodium/bile acid cotransporter 7
MSRLKRYLPDQFTLLLLATITLASLLPVHGQALKNTGDIANLLISLLFFLHGARLSRQAVAAGIMHWRLHLATFASTFILFPLLGMLLKPVLGQLVTPELYLGVLFLCFLPSTVQSSIALVSIARGNIPAAVCSASASSLLGIFFTPLLVGLLLSGAASNNGMNLDAIGKIMMQLLFPFVLGHLLRPWISDWVYRRKALLKWVDQGSILMVVYTAFSRAVTEGLWQNTPIVSLAGLVVCCAVILALALGGMHLCGRALGFNVPDRITLFFCGAQKSLATGVPMAQIIFAGHAMGAIVLPIMIYHQMQLITCSVLAGKFAKRAEDHPDGRH